MSIHRGYDPAPSEAEGRAVIGKRHPGLGRPQRFAVEFREGDPTVDAIGVFHRGSRSRLLYTGIRYRSSARFSECTDPTATTRPARLKPRCAPGLPGTSIRPSRYTSPATAPNMGRRGVDVGADDIRLDRITSCRIRRARVIDRVDGARRFPQPCRHRPAWQRRSPDQTAPWLYCPPFSRMPGG